MKKDIRCVIVTGAFRSRCTADMRNDEHTEGTTHCVRGGKENKSLPVFISNYRQAIILKYT